MELKVPVLASSRLKPVLLTPRETCGTGFSREDVGCYDTELKVPVLASSRLKPVLLTPREPCGTGFSREDVGCNTAKS